MKRIVRVIIYEGGDEDLQKQLGHSMNDGVRSGVGNVTIRAITMPDSFEAFVWQIALGLISDDPT